MIGLIVAAVTLLSAQDVAEFKRLVLRATGQPAFEFPAESPTEFFRAAGDDRITFAKYPSGTATHLVLHQEGFDIEAKKIR